MAQQRRQEYLSVATIADGNPATALALKRLADAQGVPVGDVVNLSIVSGAVQFLHKALTSSPLRSQNYTANSETRRAGLAAHALGRAFFLEFAARTHSLVGDTHARWNVVQEHQLLGATPWLLRRLGIDAFRLVTPDVNPKESGIVAAQKHPNTTISVWNRPAFDALRERGINAELTRPYFIDAFRPLIGQDDNPGLPIVVKTSGSGMPGSWQHALRSALNTTESPWALHTPQGRHAYDGFTPETDRTTRIESFYGDLGKSTELIIGYPSELVGIVADIQQRGVNAHMLALPPRGDHERQNLRFGTDNGVIVAELQMPGADTSPTWDDLPRLAVADIPHILGTLEPSRLDPSLLGTVPFWES